MFDWTMERDEILRTMLAGGATVAVAAAKLGVTRNAAMGRASRRKFPMKARNTGGWDEKRKREAREVRMEKVKARAQRKNPLVIRPKSREFDPHQAQFKPRAEMKPLPVQRPSHAAPSLRLGLTDLLPGQCRWPEGEGPFVFCGHAAEERPSCGDTKLDGKVFESYCSAHHRLAHQPVRARAP